MNKYKYIILMSILIITVTIAIIFINLKSNVFEGKIIQTENKFSLEYSFFNKTIFHTMSIKEGMSVSVKIENTSGNIDVIIVDSNDNEIYRGNKIDKENSFYINIKETGNYTFKVKGNRAKGSVKFDIIEF